MQNNLHNNYQALNRSIDTPFLIQHNPNDYYTPYYLSPARMSSYSHQFRLAMGTDCKKYLNIGSANNILSRLLSKQDKQVTNLDLDIHTCPTVNAILPFLPFNDDAFEVLLCFQMLEHMPFTMINECLKEFSRVSNRYLILSLPDISLSKREIIKSLMYKIFHHPREWKGYRFSKTNREHFWEIGDGWLTRKKIINIIEKENFTLENDFRNSLNPYHHFFVFTIEKES